MVRYPRYEYPAWREPRSMLDLGFDVEGAAPMSVPTLPGGYQLRGGSGFKLRLGDRM